MKTLAMILITSTLAILTTSCSLMGKTREERLEFYSDTLSVENKIDAYELYIEMYGDEISSRRRAFIEARLETLYENLAVEQELELQNDAAVEEHNER